MKLIILLNKIRPQRIFFYFFKFKKKIFFSILRAENGNKGSDEEKEKCEEELSLGVKETYTVLAKILCLKPMLVMIVVLLTGKVWGGGNLFN